MTDLTMTLSAQHGAHKPRIDELRHLADRAPAINPGELAEGLDGILDFLTSTLLPHLAAEESELYPALTDLADEPGAAAMLRFDHDDIRHRVAQLRAHHDELTSQLLPTARREAVGDLYGLHAVLNLHVAKEEEIYLPLLDRSLAAERAAAILDAMRRSVELQQRLADGLSADGG